MLVSAEVDFSATFYLFFTCSVFLKIIYKQCEVFLGSVKICIYFHCLITLARASSSMLNIIGESGHSHLVSGLEVKCSEFHH